ncbi:MAG: aspartate kinase [Bdellovibrionales bacterium]|nr:aspartate kinase [Bdellovibrionales bacterium]MBT3524947.1 aspartate kinase [Bdellovibrionales bacterium]MBT7766989.1 aspartate kinase [Bdellovibrionales bacterium]
MTTKSKQGENRSPLTILKFGGSSLSSPEAIKGVISVIKSATKRANILLLFSAMGKTTQKLLDLTNAIESGKSDQGSQPLAQIRAFHFSQLASFGLSEKDSQCHRIHHLFDELNKLFQGLTILKDNNPKIQDKILSYGELLSSSIMEIILIQQGVAAHWLDSRLVIITDTFFGKASPIMDLSQDRCQAVIRPILEAGEIPILQGFIGSTKKGLTSTLGFEGSDYSATLFGNFLDATQIELHKTVDGVMSADPSVEPQAKTVDAMNYQEAAALTYLGASCIHAKAIGPASQKDIPVVLKNSTNPKFPGTIISNQGQTKGAKSITSISNMVRVKIEQSGNPANQLPPLLKWLQFERVEIYHLEYSLSSYSILIKESSYQGIYERTDMPDHSATTGLSLISIVGNSIKENSYRNQIMEILTKEISKLEHYKLLDHATSNAISLLVPDTATDQLLHSIHRQLF